MDEDYKIKKKENLFENNSDDEINEMFLIESQKNKENQNFNTNDTTHWQMNNISKYFKTILNISH